ncbi:hypothetical protein [Devosia salina]|uniref:hypothetical protein n=1 Tax=Devosia salina TaxID=2860336 RepID=UPI001F0B4823|nr:hypothetical protein [Devosia salina]
MHVSLDILHAGRMLDGDEIGQGCGDDSGPCPKSKSRRSGALRDRNSPFTRCRISLTTLWLALATEPRDMPPATRSATLSFFG